MPTPSNHPIVTVALRGMAIDPEQIDNLEDAKQALRVVGQELFNVVRYHHRSNTAGVSVRMPRPTMDPPSVTDVLLERKRQIEELGHTAGKDDQYRSAELVRGAICYCLNVVAYWGFGSPFIAEFSTWMGRLWPWGHFYIKPRSPRRDLVKACALLLAEIDRLDRM
jgi:hypothetical protein